MRFQGFASAMTEGWGQWVGTHRAALGGVCGVVSLFTVAFHWWFRLLRWACVVCACWGNWA